MDKRFSSKSDSVIMYERLNRSQYEVNLQGVAQLECKNFHGEGINDCGKVRETATAATDVCDISQQDFSWAMLGKLPVDNIILYTIRMHLPEHFLVWIDLADGTFQAIFPHQPSDLLEIHENWRGVMQKCHVNATDALGVSTVVISVKNLFKRFSIR